MEIQMEGRKCVICSKPFRVLEKSDRKTCSTYCEETLHPDKPNRKKQAPAQFDGEGNLIKTDDGVMEHSFTYKYTKKTENHEARKKLVELTKSIKVVDKSKAKPKVKAEPKSKPVERDYVKEFHDRWEQYVSKAKIIVLKLTDLRYELATLAVEACDIKHGGGDHWSEFEGVYTLSKFANDIGIVPKTLSNWVRTKRVLDQLKDKGRDIDHKRDWAVASKTADQHSKNDPVEAVEKTFDNWDGETSRFMHGVSRMRTFRHHIFTNVDKKKIDQKHIDQLALICADIIKWCDDESTVQ